MIRFYRGSEERGGAMQRVTLVDTNLAPPQIRPELRLRTMYCDLDYNLIFNIDF